MKVTFHDGTEREIQDLSSWQLGAQRTHLIMQAGDRRSKYKQELAITKLRAVNSEIDSRRSRIQEEDAR